MITTEEKGYYIKEGYMGKLPNGQYQLFASESDYKEYVEDEDNEREDN